MLRRVRDQDLASGRREVSLGCALGPDKDVQFSPRFAPVIRYVVVGNTVILESWLGEVEAGGESVLVDDRSGADQILLSVIWLCFTSYRTAGINPNLSIGNSSCTSRYFQILEGR